MSAEEPTAAEMLTAVNAAILSLITNKTKSLSINDRTYQYNNLPELRDMRSQLQKECRSTSNSIRLGDVSGTSL